MLAQNFLPSHLYALYARMYVSIHEHTYVVQI